ncbi:unnamed protein product [Ambrosiozyma monospora]|uniref:Unnamed protein product n=1 Tax=Ambrosiozyma monospora TaxID=43982 RepID=A0A9W6YWP0_AMBMO|nr:unnamed protein product [Ambrosiozyma monospora]
MSQPQNQSQLPPSQNGSPQIAQTPMNVSTPSLPVGTPQSMGTPQLNEANLNTPQPQPQPQTQSQSQPHPVPQQQQQQQQQSQRSPQPQKLQKGLVFRPQKEKSMCGKLRESN